MDRTDVSTIEDLKSLSAARRWAKNGTARKVRELSELTQGEIAEACGVDQSTVALWETGRRTPAGDAARMYARVLIGLGVNLHGGIMGIERTLTGTQPPADASLDFAETRAE